MPCRYKFTPLSTTRLHPQSTPYPIIRRIPEVILLCACCPSCTWSCICSGSDYSGLTLCCAQAPEVGLYSCFRPPVLTRVWRKALEAVVEVCSPDSGWVQIKVTYLFALCSVGLASEIHSCLPAHHGFFS